MAEPQAVTSSPPPVKRGRSFVLDDDDDDDDDEITIQRIIDDDSVHAALHKVLAQVRAEVLPRLGNTDGATVLGFLERQTDFTGAHEVLLQTEYARGLAGSEAQPVSEIWFRIDFDTWKWKRVRRKVKRAESVQPTNSAAEVPSAAAAQLQPTFEVLPAYMPFSLGSPHVSKLCAAAMTQFVDQPEAARRTDLLHKSLHPCHALSAPQRDAITMARVQHEKGRAFVIADGTGCGKGREGVGIVLNTMLKDGCGRALYFSVAPTLQNLQTDVADVFGLVEDVASAAATVYDVRNCKHALPDQGIVFVPYTQVAKRDNGAGGNKTLDRLLSWVKEQRASIVLDESHKITKIWTPVPSTSAQNMDRFLLEVRDTCRITFMSATFASCLDDLQIYAPHLGLVGPEFLSFEELKSHLDKRADAGALELLNAELVHSQSLIARQLSFEGVHFSTVTVGLTDEYEEMHSSASSVWQQIIKQPLFEPGDFSTRQLRSLLWGAHQRFWKALILCSKVGKCIELAKAELAESNAVVISLLYTGEAAANRAAARAATSGEDDEASFDCNVRDTLLDFLKTTREKVKELGIEISDEEWAALDEIERDTKNLQLPEAAPLDLLKQGLGGTDAVAELTGRQHFVIKNQAGKWERVQHTGTMDRERAAFQSGEKQIAVLTTAGSTGISLHAEQLGARPRVQLLFELPWSSVQCMQQLGRVHRSNQRHTPRYVILATEFGPDLRFAATVASRLQALGAISSGDRTTIQDGARVRIEGANDVEADLLVSRHGDAAAKKLCESCSYEARTVLIDAGLVAPGYATTSLNAKQFMNRLLGMPVSKAQSVFDEFADRVQHERNEAERKGRASEEPIMQLTVDGVKVELLQELKCGSNSNVCVFSVDRGLNFAEASAMRQALLNLGNSTSTVYWSDHEGGCLVFRRTQTTGRKYLPTGWQPLAVRNAHRWPAETTASAQFQQNWDRVFSQYSDKMPRVETVNVAKLSALPVLNRLFRGDEKPHMARVTNQDGSKFVGLVISERQMASVHHQVSNSIDLTEAEEGELSEEDIEAAEDEMDAMAVETAAEAPIVHMAVEEAAKAEMAAEATATETAMEEPAVDATAAKETLVAESVSAPARKRPREHDAHDAPGPVEPPAPAEMVAETAAGRPHQEEADDATAPPRALLTHLNQALQDAQKSAMAMRNKMLQERVDRAPPGSMTGTRLIELLTEVEADMVAHHRLKARLSMAASALTMAWIEAEAAMLAWREYCAGHVED